MAAADFDLITITETTDPYLEQIQEADEPQPDRSHTAAIMDTDMSS